MVGEFQNKDRVPMVLQQPIVFNSAAETWGRLIIVTWVPQAMIGA